MSEKELGQKWDRCLADSAIKLGTGLGLGIVFSVVFFKRRTWPDVYKRQTSKSMHGTEYTTVYMEESTEYQEMSRYKPHVLLTQENTQIKDLQHENRELCLSLEEHQYALELIMGRYRKQMLQLMMEKKELDTKPVLSLHQDHAKEVQGQLERICEMGQVMRQAMQMDDQRYCSVKERLAQLQIENKELRGLLSISNGSVRPHREKTNPAETAAERPKKQEP